MPLKRNRTRITVCELLQINQAKNGTGGAPTQQSLAMAFADTTSPGAKSQNTPSEPLLYDTRNFPGLDEVPGAKNVTDLLDAVGFAADKGGVGGPGAQVQGADGLAQQRQRRQRGSEVAHERREHAADGGDVQQRADLVVARLARLGRVQRRCSRRRQRLWPPACAHHAHADALRQRSSQADPNPI